MSNEPGEGEGWVESTEGDLDPDLTEEAGYAGWDPPPHRLWTPRLLRAVAVFLIVVMVGSVVVLALL
ncbi:MAG: hypothetical protein GEU80_09600 [Dehalococcoidia bacterium]|nr:hypothetical protein [Dehalococcoidia bacterium]